MEILKQKLWVMEVILWEGQDSSYWTNYQEILLYRICKEIHKIMGRNLTQIKEAPRLSSMVDIQYQIMLEMNLILNKTLKVTKMEILFRNSILTP